MRASFDLALWPAEEAVPWPETIRVLILSDGTRVPSGGPAVGYTPGSGKRSLCGREA